MLTPKGPKVIEYNCRFGDPETQVVLPLLESDLLTVMMACRNGTLSECEVKFADSHAACVVMASEGYPKSYKSGFEIKVADDFNGELYIAGAKAQDGKILSSGGRVLGVVNTGSTLSEAVENAYREVEKVSFDNAFYRKDIGKKALEKTEG